MEIEELVCVCRFSIHANLYAVINHYGYRCPIKGNAVVFFNLFSKLYVWVNCTQVIVELAHTPFGDRSDYFPRICTTTMEDERQWK